MGLDAKRPLQVEESHVRPRAGSERSPFDSQDSGWPRGQKLHQSTEGDDFRTHQPIERERDRGLEPHDPEGSGVEVVVFLVLVVRRMVGGDGVDGAVR